MSHKMNHKMSENQNIAWITGASSGIGEAVALRLAKDGWHVAITARRKEKLEEIANTAKNAAGKIYPYAGDVTDEKAMQTLASKIKKDLGGINLVILNAGTYKPDPVEQFTAENFKMHTEINLNGTANTLAAILPDMLERQSGHIAIVASIAGYRGLPLSLSYGPTKAALINMAEALSIDCMDKGIKVQVVNPGFIKTPLTDKNDFHMPMLMDVDKAADKFVEGLSKNKFEITFPWLFCFLTKMTGWMLPDWLYFKLIKKATAGRNASHAKNA